MRPFHERFGSISVAETEAVTSFSGFTEIGLTRNLPFMAVSIKNLHIYTAIKRKEVRSSIEDALVLDGFDVSSFDSPDELWEAFQEKPARMIITDRKFGPSPEGLKLVRKLRAKYQLPYVFVVMLSSGSKLAEIEEGIAAGVDDYLIKPHNPFQIRSRMMVGIRWLRYIDSLFERDAAAKKS